MRRLATNTAYYDVVHARLTVSELEWFVRKRWTHGFQGICCMHGIFFLGGGDSGFTVDVVYTLQIAVKVCILYRHGSSTWQPVEAMHMHARCRSVPAFCVYTVPLGF